MKKKTIITGLMWILILAAAAILYIYVREDSEDGLQVRANYSFRNDGSLYFIETSEGDTLSMLEIEKVSTPDEINRGLMYRDSLGENQGMLFMYDQSTERTFWMKNTRFSLDLLFIGDDLTVLYIAHRATPYSETPIPGFFPARFVLEVNGGYCDRHGIGPGVRVNF